MSAEENKAVSRRWFEEVFGEGKLELADELMAADVTIHEPATPALPDGIEGARQLVSTYRSAFPDLHFTVEDVLAEGDKVVVRWTGRGTHNGDLPGIPATGRNSTVTGISIDRFENGKVAESWINWDTLGMLRNIGVMPAPQTAEA